MSLHTDERPIEEAEIESTISPDAETNKQTETKAETQTNVPSPSAPIDSDAEEMELLADLRRKTDKDIDGSAKASEVTSETTSDYIAPSSSGASSGSVKPAMYMQNHELVAKLCVNCMNVLLGMILQMIADDWSEDAEKKYTLSPTRKGEILEPLTLVLAQSKNKYNPVVILVITVLVAYAPMFMTAFRSRKEKAKLKRIKKRVLDKTGSETASEEVEDITADFKRQIKELEAEVNEHKKKPEKLATKTVFKMTEADKTRLKKIKSKKGRRSAEDEQFLKDMGLDGLV